MDSGHDHLAVGLPHSEIHGSTIARISPWLFAACYVLHRLLVPRHPPNALLRLISHFPSRTIQPEDRTAQLFKSPDGLGSHHGTSSRRSPGRPGIHAILLQTLNAFRSQHRPSQKARAFRVAPTFASNASVIPSSRVKQQPSAPHGPKASLRSNHKESPACFTDPNRPVRPAPRLRGMVEADGIEPTTPCLQSRCSPTELRPHLPGAAPREGPRWPARSWWAREDLNFRPHAYQARALTN
jgi:hypothetical protein